MINKNQITQVNCSLLKQKLEVQKAMLHFFFCYHRFIPPLLYSLPQPCQQDSETVLPSLHKSKASRGSRREIRVQPSLWRTAVRLWLPCISQLHHSNHTTVPALEPHTHDCALIFNASGRQECGSLSSPHCLPLLPLFPFLCPLSSNVVFSLLPPNLISVFSYFPEVAFSFLCYLLWDFLSNCAWI